MCISFEYVSLLKAGMLLLEDEAKTMDQLGIDDGIQVLIEGRYIVSEFAPW